ncbi:MAG: 2-hydroxyacid dehydrogenase [Flavobacteriaceae bacterium]|nr:2-hydroxyacid dehydrogenase [Flavobacteriaceae bacterium]
MKILCIDRNHPLLIEQLKQHNFQIVEDYTSTKPQIEKIIHDFDGIIIRSRFPLDKEFLSQAQSLKFIGRVGAGLENIDTDFAQTKGILLFNAPEGNRDAVGEHSLGMLLAIMNLFRKSDNEVRNGIWLREENRGEEIKGKTVAIIGYGNMGKAFAQRLQGFECNVICYDIKPNVGDKNCRQTSMKEIFNSTDILSLHIPQTPETIALVDANYINQFQKPFYLLNTARGKSVVTKDLVIALKSGKIKAAALDVFEFEKASFESLQEFSSDFQYLVESDRVLLTPHIAGWTHESKIKLAQTIVNKILAHFNPLENKL